jgi:hypothetical protein
MRSSPARRSLANSVTVDWFLAPRRWGFNLKSKSTNYPDHGHHGDPPPTRIIPMLERGIDPETTWLVVRSSDHEAGQTLRCRVIWNCYENLICTTDKYCDFREIQKHVLKSDSGHPSVPPGPGSLYGLSPPPPPPNLSALGITHRKTLFVLRDLCLPIPIWWQNRIINIGPWKSL